MTSPVSPARPNAQVHRVLVVEDEEALAFGVKDALEHAGFQVQVVHDGPDRARSHPHRSNRI
jgi:DNA-binding response OmpR family regulator